MEHNHESLCEQCDSYMLGECSEQEREAFKAHLPACPACRGKIEDFRRVWQALPGQLDEIEAPVDLKAEVMGAIFSEESGHSPEERGEERIPQQQAPEHAVAGAARQAAKRFAWNWSRSLIAALVPLLALSVIWNYALFKDRDTQEEDLASPAQIVSLMPLKPADPAFDSVKGTACVLVRGNRTMLVVYLYGLQATAGSEAYQVWLKKGGQRSNAGTFHVGSNGLGVLSIDIQPQASIDSVGVTLEPDAYGTAPRGIKIAGS